MQSRQYRMLVVLICSWLFAGTFSPIQAQQVFFTVDNLADDANAHAWDNPDTPEIDESADGHCEDAAHRCTMRAAIEEAKNMGQPVNLTVEMPGTITLTEGSLDPLSGSFIHGNLQTTIITNSTIDLDNNTTVRGLKFDNGIIGIDVIGNDNTISGNAFSNDWYGIIVGGNRNIIGGSSPSDRNIFTRNNYAAILLARDNNVVIGNYIGIDAQGDTAGNQFGVFVTGDNNTIGGTNPDMRNVISGNRVAGTSIATVPGVGLGNAVIGNYIGTDPTGMQARPNSAGIEVVSGHATIGGALPAERNLISGNTAGGIETRGDALAVEIIGNDIGLDASGSVLANRDGIDLSPGSFDCVIEGNRISNNQLFGILIFGTTTNPSWNHRIRGNEITRNEFGIGIYGKANDIVIGSSLSQDFAPNMIQYNNQNGVYMNVRDGQLLPRANTIRKNDFRGNTLYGVRIVQDDFPVQDNIQPPTIQSYTDLGNGHATVTATHDRVGALVDVYVGEINATSHYEGRQWLGSGTVLQSNVPFTFTIDACNCDHIVATATDLAENTSEFYPFAVTPLPITLLSFTGAVIHGNHVRLDWTTLTEINNYGFEIQRSLDSENNYGTLPNSFIPGHGTTNEPHEYVFIDSSAFPAHWYYRLRQIDLDGAVHYSDGIAVNMLTSVPEAPLPDKFALNQNYPNPFNPTTIIRFAIPVGTRGRASLRVFDVLGREVKTLVNEELQAGNYERTFNADGLASGLYFYTLTAGSFVQTKKLLLLR